MRHSCANAGCNEDATMLVIEAHPLFRMLFRSGAGLTCERHAKDLEAVGGVSIALADISRWRCALQDEALVEAGADALRRTGIVGATRERSEAVLRAAGLIG